MRSVELGQVKRVNCVLFSRLHSTGTGTTLDIRMVGQRHRESYTVTAKLRRVFIRIDEGRESAMLFMVLVRGRMRTVDSTQLSTFCRRPNPNSLFSFALPSTDKEQPHNNSMVLTDRVVS